MHRDVARARRDLPSALIFWATLNLPSLGRLMLRRPARRHQTRCCHRAALPLASLSTAITMDTTGIGMRMQPLPSLGCARCAPSGSAGGGASTSAATQV